MSLANISIVGNLVKAPEQMHFSSGKVKTTLVVAVNAYGKPSRGGDAADFYKVETWGKLAELASQYLAKGNQVAVSGRLIFDRWTDKEGKNRVTPVVEVTQLSLPTKQKAVDSENGELLASEGVSKNVVTGNLACPDAEDMFDGAQMEPDTADAIPESYSRTANGATLIRYPPKQLMETCSA